MTEQYRRDEENHEIFRSIRCVIVGSFRYYDNFIRPAIDTFETSAVQVLAPRKGRVVRAEGGYRILDVDADRDPNELQRWFFFQMQRADFIYVVNPDGYIGSDSTGDILLATWGYRKAVYAREPIRLELSNDSAYSLAIARTIRTMSIEHVIARAKDGTLELDEYFSREWGRNEDSGHSVLD